MHVLQFLQETHVEKLREKLDTCRHFFMDSEMENGRNIVFNFAMKALDAQTLSKNIDTVFENPNFIAKLNVAYGIVLKNIEDGTCRY